jgi:hypothetical protein
MVCTISRILFERDIYLGWLLPITSSGTKSFDCSKDSTALHTSKDLAVSLCMLPYKLIHKGCPYISTVGVSARTSWITQMGITHYSRDPPTGGHCVFGLSSPRQGGAHLSDALQDFSTLDFLWQIGYTLFVSYDVHKIFNHNMPKRKDLSNQVFSFARYML